MDWYNSQGIPFKEKNAQDNRAHRREMLTFSNGDPTVPVIVIDGHLKQIGWEGRG
jgi:glutaredoxin